jgi:hypothetical protein
MTDNINSSLFENSPISRRDFTRLSAATVGTLALPGAATAKLTSGKMTNEYTYVINHIDQEFTVPTLIEFTSEAGFAELDTLGINYRKTTTPAIAAHAHLNTGEVSDVLDIPAAERLSYSPGSNPFWRLGYYPLGVFPEPRQSTAFIDYEQMIDGLKHLESTFPSWLKFYSIGESPGHYNYVSGEEDPKDIWVAEVTNNINDDANFEDKEKVMFNLSLHGLERAGAEAGSRFIEDLLKGEEPEIEALLDDLVLIFLYPNPDGWVAKHPQYESGWQLLGPDGGAPVIPFYERGNAGVYDTNRQAPSVGWIDPAHSPADPLGANLEDDQPGIDADVPDYAQKRVPDQLAVVEHFRKYNNLNYGADLHGALFSSKFVLGLISQDQFDHGQIHELFEFCRNINDTLEDALDTWTTLADVQKRVTGQMNPELLGYETLPEEAFDYAGIWDTIGYTVSGAVLDWMSHPEELGGLGMTTMDFEMAYSHMIGSNVYDPELVRMQVIGYTTAIRTIAKYAKQQTTATIETGGDSLAYVTTDSLTRSSEDLSFIENPNMGFVQMDAGEHFEGTIGPGASNARARKRHTFTAVADADKIEAALSWIPPGQDLEFYLLDADGDTLASAQTADNPERIAARVEPGAEYTFVVETWLNAVAQYEIDAIYYDYAETDTTVEKSKESAMLGPSELTEFYRRIREEANSLSVHVHPQPGVLHGAKLLNPNGHVVRSYSPTADAEEGYTGMEEWIVENPEPGEWSVEIESLMDTRTGEVTVQFGTLQSTEINPDPTAALGYEQRAYEVSPFAFFEEYGPYADAPWDPLTIDEVKGGAAADYDNLVIIHDDSISDADYVDALDSFVSDGGNLVLTDTGIRLLAPMDNEFAADISHEHVAEETLYIAHLEERYPGHELLEGTRPIQQELWKVAPLGYSTGFEAPMTLLNSEVFDAAGGTIAGKTSNRVAAGSITSGTADGTGIHVIGGLLPPASQSNLHPFGLLNYAIAFLGSVMLTNALGYRQDRFVNGDRVATFGDIDSFSVDPSVTAEREDDGDLFTAGQTNRVDITVSGNATVLIRDRLPMEWTVVNGDPRTAYVEGETRFVEFEASVEEGTRTYFAEAPAKLTETQSYEFGPVEYSLDGGENWIEIPGTTDRNNVLGVGTDL